MPPPRIIRKILFSSLIHELFSPTTSHWFWDEKCQHTRTFNIPALKAAVAEVLGVAPWRIRPTKRGGGGKVIVAWGGRVVIIKLPDPVMPARVVTASEVASMEFVRTELDILAPKGVCDYGGGG